MELLLVKVKAPPPSSSCCSFDLQSIRRSYSTRSQTGVEGQKIDGVLVARYLAPFLMAEIEFIHLAEAFPALRGMSHTSYRRRRATFDQSKQHTKKLKWYILAPAETRDNPKALLPNVAMLASYLVTPVQVRFQLFLFFCPWSYHSPDSKLSHMSPRCFYKLCRLRGFTTQTVS